MTITVHMFGEETGEPLDLVRDRDPDGAERWYREPDAALDFDCIAVGTFRQQDQPLWSRLLDGYFDIAWPSSISTSVALLARAADRWFAVTFGHGRHLLREEFLVPDFGLRVTANSVSADRVRQLTSVLLDGTTRRTRQTLAVPSRLSRFTVDLECEWVRSLGGVTDDDLTRGMTGSQSLAVDVSPGWELKHLHELLRHLLHKYEAVGYRSVFPFIDLVVPLHPADPLVPRLEQELLRRLPQLGTDIGIMVPDPQPGETAPSTYWVSTGRGRSHRFLLDRLGIRTAVRQANDPLRLRVQGRDAEGHAVGPSRSLREFLAAEISLGREGDYVLADGRWFRLDAERSAWLERALAAVTELGPEHIEMPVWYVHDGERRYNIDAARTRSWLLLDRETFLGPDRRRDRIEVCDLLTSAGDLICVKRLRTAGGLSHLFSQGSVSATLYRFDRDYRNHVHELYRHRWPGRELGRPTIVYAIGTDRRGPVTRTIPFFSRVNLTRHVATIAAADLGVAITRIPVTQFRQRTSPYDSSGKIGDGEWPLMDC
jgi:uncharacterized protein (TIGR04141 family)